MLVSPNILGLTFLLSKAFTTPGVVKISYLIVPKFHSSSHKSAKQFWHSFAFDASTLWNSLPDDVRGSPTLWSFHKKLKAFLFAKTYPP